MAFNLWFPLAWHLNGGWLGLFVIGIQWACVVALEKTLTGQSSLRWIPALAMAVLVALGVDGIPMHTSGLWH